MFFFSNTCGPVAVVYSKVQSALYNPTTAQTFVMSLRDLEVRNLQEKGRCNGKVLQDPKP